MLSKMINISALSRLIEPHSTILDPEQRRKARLLSVLLLVMVILGIFGLVSTVVADYQTHSPSHSPYILVSVINLIAMATYYVLSRTAYYKVSAVLTLISLYAATVAVGLSLPNEGIAQVLPYLSLGILLCSMLFSLRATILFAVAGIIGILALPALSIVSNFLSIFYPAIFITTMTALV